MKAKLIASLLCSSALGAAPALAQGFGGMLAAMDANGDGSITHAEAEAARVAMFNQLDTNHDGAISADERAAATDNGPGGGRMLGMADTNGDGVITRAEFMGRPYFMFDRGDANHDGVLDASELAALRSSFGAQ